MVNDTRFVSFIEGSTTPKQNLTASFLLQHLGQRDTAIYNKFIDFESHSFLVYLGINKKDNVMKLSKKMLTQIELEAKRFKLLMEEPNPEVKALIAEIKENVKTMPKNMTKEEEITYILNN